ncbi:MAG: carboxypeptidase-like regulatory domain-containing protein [Candidatus ainarchaeum sp.]|nr:carboxypeptidase-like regulatory domain-containing protein [Candidatus ainarchaeum sp.]
MSFRELYTKIEDKYYAMLDKINQVIPIHKLTDQIDKVMPSMIFFSVFFLVIIGLIIWLIVASVGSSTITFEFYSNGTLASGEFNVTFSSEGGEQIALVKNGIAFGNYDMGDFVTVKIKEPYTFSKTYEIKSELMKIDLPGLDKLALKEAEKKNKEISIYLYDGTSGSLVKEKAIVSASCEDFSKEIEVTGNTKLAIPDNCSYVDLLATADGYLQSKKSCDTALCKIFMDKKGTTTPTTVVQSIPKNKVVVYVKDNKGTSLEGFDVKITGVESIQDVLNQAKTNAFGSYTFEDITVGNYKLYVSDPSGTLTTVSKDLIVVSGPPVIADITMEKPPLGYFNVKVNTENTGGFALATLYVKDVNDNYLGTVDINTGVEYKIGVYEKGKYIFNVIPVTGYDENYSIVTEEREYDLQSGDKKVDLVLKELKYYENTKVNLKVVKEKDDGSEEPLPNMKIIVENDEGWQIELPADKTKTDVNGSVSFILPSGVYIVHAYNYYFTGETNLQLLDTPGATELPETDAKIAVQIGKAKIKVSVKDEDGKDLTDVKVDIYMDSNFFGPMFISQEKYKEVQVEAYHSYYVKVTKEGYLNYYSPELVLKKDQLMDEKVILYNKLEHLNSDPEMIYVGAYKDQELKTKLDKIDQENEFYYVFDLVVPEFSEKLYEISGVKVTGVAGNKNLPVLESDLVLKNVFASGKTHLFSTITGTSLAEQGEDFTYTAKSFTSEFNGGSYVARMVVHLRSTDIPQIGDKLFFYYKLDIDTKQNGSFNLPIPTDAEYYELIKFLGKRELCENEVVCVDTYLDGMATSSLPGGSENKVELYSGKQNNILVNLTKGDELPTELEASKFTVFNSTISSVENFNSLKDFYVDLEDMSLVHDKITSTKPIEIDSQTAPVFVKEASINNYKINTTLKFDSKIELVEPENSKLYFNFDTTNEVEQVYVDLETMNDDEPLKLEGLPEGDLLIPGIENSFDVIVKSGEDKIGAAIIKIYFFDGMNWSLENTFTAGNDGVAKITIKPHTQGEEVKISAEKESYLPCAKILLVSTDLFEINKSKNETKIVYPKDLNPVAGKLGIKNKTNIDFEVYNVEFVGSSNLGLLMNVEKMENYLKDAKPLLIPNEETIGFKMHYNDLPVQTLTDSVALDDVHAMLSVRPKGSESEIVLDVPITLEITFNNQPLEENCVSVEFTKDLSKLSGETEFSAVFLNGVAPETYLIIENSCTIELNEGQGSVADYEFADFLLDASFSKMANNIMGGFTINIEGASDNTKTENYSLFKVDTGEVIKLLSPKKKSNDKYIYKITFEKLGDYEFGKNGTNVEFKFIPKYQGVGNQTISFGEKKLSMNVSEKKISDCLYFGLNTNVNTQSVATDTEGVATEEGSEQQVIMPISIDEQQYYLKGGNGILRLGYDYVDETVGPESLNANLTLDNTSNLQITRPGNDYVVNSLPLLIKNTCGIDLEIKLCKEDDEYCRIPDVGFMQFDTLYGVEGFELYNTPLTIGADKEIQFSLLRPQEFSGAVVLPLYVKNTTGEYGLAKEAKVSVQSSLFNPYFVLNPFVEDGNMDITFYKNEYYPDMTGWSDPIEKQLLTNDTDSSSYLRLIQITPGPIFNYDGDDDSGNILDSFEALNPKSIDYTDDSSDVDQSLSEKVVGVVGGMISGGVDILYYIKEVEYNLPQWAIIKIMANRFHKGSLSDLDDDVAATAEYRIWSESLPIQNILNNKQIFDGFNNDWCELEDDSCFFNYEGPVQKIADILRETVGTKYPYFTSISVARLEGDCGWSNVIAYAQGFCPQGYELAKIELFRKDGGTVDGRDNTFSQVTEGKTTKYLYGGSVNFEDKYINEESDTGYQMMTICRLPRSEFGEVDRAVGGTMKYSSFGSGSIFDSSGIENIVKSKIQATDIFNCTDCTSELREFLFDVYDAEAADMDCEITPPGYFDAGDNDEYEIYQNNSSGCPGFDYSKINLLNELYQGKENDVDNYKARTAAVVTSIVTNSGKTTSGELAYAANMAFAGSDTFFGYIDDAYGINFDGLIIELCKDGSKTKNNGTCSHATQLRASFGPYNYNSISITAAEFDGLNSNIRLYLEPKTMKKDFAFYKKVNSCPYGGYTGPEVKPTINYTWAESAIKKDFCVVEGEENYADVNACDLVQFSKVISKQFSDDMEQKHFTVKLMYDNYSESAINSLIEWSFFEHIKDLRILNYDGSPVGEIGPGIYNVDLIRDENVLDVYLSYLTSYGPDHIFYRMPVDNVGTGAIPGIGTSMNYPINYDGFGSFSQIKDDVSTLKEYSVSNHDLKTINTTQKGTVFAGYFNDGLIYWNNMDVYLLTAHLGTDENKEILLTAPEYDTEIYEVLKSGWIYEDGEDYYYAENAGFGFGVVDTDNGKKLKISNASGYNRTVKKILFYPQGSALDLPEQDDVTLTQLDVEPIYSITDIFKGLENENICYRALEDGSEYYYNPLKLLDIIQTQ